MTTKTTITPNTDDTMRYIATTATELTTIHNDTTRLALYSHLQQHGFGAASIGSHDSGNAALDNRMEVTLTLTLPVVDDTAVDALARLVRRLNACHSMLDEPFGSVGLRVETIGLPAHLNPAPEPEPEPSVRVFRVTLEREYTMRRVVKSSGTATVTETFMVLARSQDEADAIAEFASTSEVAQEWFGGAEEELADDPSMMTAEWDEDDEEVEVMDYEPVTHTSVREVPLRDTPYVQTFKNSGVLMAMDENGDEVEAGTPEFDALVAQVEADIAREASA